MVTVTKLFTFDACHHLPYYEGDCHNLHGHTYKLEVTVTGKCISDKTNPKCGMIIDFKDLNKIVKKCVINRYDHTNLNNYFENPTAELMVAKMGEDIQESLPKGIMLLSVKLWEKIDSSYAEYTPYLYPSKNPLKYANQFADQDTLRSAT